MKEGHNNLVRGFERLSKLMEYVASLDGRVTIMERDLLLQELREMYVEVLSMDVTSQSVADGSKEPVEESEVVTFENIMQTMQGESATEESPFAPAEPEPEMAPAPEPVMEKIEGNQYEELFEQPSEVKPKMKYEKPMVYVEEQQEESIEQHEEVKREEPVMKQEVKKTEPVMKREEIKHEEPVMKQEVKKAELVMKHEEIKHEESVMKHEVKKTEPVMKHEEVKHEEPVMKHEVKKTEPVMKHEEVKREEPVEHKSTKGATMAEQPSLFDYLSQVVPTVAEKPAPTTIADKFGVNRQVLETQLEQKVNRHKVSDLRTVININDKFSFMTELFHNNMRAYNDFILRLNDITETDEAMAYVSEVSNENGWDEHSLAVKTFYKILERKF